MTDPHTPHEWRVAVVFAETLLRFESARLYGLITGGPTVAVARCEDILERGRRLGYVPTEAEITEAVGAIVRGLP
jgi:hypothetical protein